MKSQKIINKKDKPPIDCQARYNQSADGLYATHRPCNVANFVIIFCNEIWLVHIINYRDKFHY